MRYFYGYTRGDVISPTAEHVGWIEAESNEDAREKIRRICEKQPFGGPLWICTSGNMVEHKDLVTRYHVRDDD